MKRCCKQIPLALLFLVAAAAMTRGEDDVATRLSQYMTKAVSNDHFSGAVLVKQAGRPLLREAYGQASVELEVPNRVATKFRLGSITKQFTSMAVMILAEQGKLAVDDLISKHLEKSPEGWDKIAIRHLLSHTSGITSYTGFPQMMSRTVRLPATPDEVIATFRDKSLDFEPGEKFVYSNSGYIVLGKVIERASGKDYETFVRENIFEPLGMKDSGYDHNMTILPGRAAGYMRLPSGGLTNAPYIDMSWPYAAGSLYSTVGDLAIWDEALSAGKLIGPSSYEVMFTPVKGNYAFGWIVRDREEHKEIGHAGGIHGFSSSILRYPDDKLCVVVLSNVLPIRSERLGLDLAGIALGISAREAEAGK